MFLRLIALHFISQLLCRTQFLSQSRSLHSTLLSHFIRFCTTIKMKSFLALLLAVPAVFASAINGDLVKREDPRISYYGSDSTNLAGGACQFASLPAGLYGGAISKSLWDGAGACGQCVEITGPSQKPIKVMVSFVPCIKRGLLC